MDYDDNDFQSQNLHLAGEGSAKFPPVLRQYALPKFDFDDTLQGHARFDSLVEAEVFLGIESNDDTQWIEDYSRGNSGIGFSSCAAESCSILRRKNVWSEATSSESVEMLLKSVGQEDINLPQAVTGESNACDKLDCLTRPMDPTLNDDDSSFCEMRELQPTLLPDIIPGKLAGVEEDARGEQPWRDDNSEVEAVRSVNVSLGEVDPNVVDVIVDMPSTEGNAVIDEINEQPSSITTDTSVDILLKDKREDDILASGNHVDSFATCTQSGSGKNSVSTQIDDIERVVNADELSKDDRNPHLSASVVEDRLAVDSSIASLQSIASMTLKGDSVFDSGNGEVISEVPAETITFDDKVLCKRMEIGNQAKASMHEVLPMILEDDSRIEACAGEGKNINAEVCALQGPKTDSVGQMAYTHKINVEEQKCLPLCVEIQINKSDPSTSPLDKSNVSKVGDSINDHIGDGPCKFLGETHGMSSLRDVHDTCALPRENLYSEGSTPPFSLGESTQLSEDALCRQHDVDTEHVSVNDKDDVMLSSDSVSESGEGTESISLPKNVVESEMIDTKVENDAVADDESVVATTLEDAAKATCGTSISSFEDANTVTFGTTVSTCEDANVVTCGTIQGGSWSSVENLAQNKDADHKEDQMPTTLVGLTEADRNEENSVACAAAGSLCQETATEGSFPVLDTSQPEAESHPFPEAVKSAYDVAGQGVCQRFDQSSSKNLNKDECNTERWDVPKAGIASEVSRPCRQEMDVDPVFDAKPIPINDSLVTQSLPPLSGETLGNDRTDKENAELTPDSAGVDRQQAIAANIKCDAEQKEGSFPSVAFPQSLAKSSVMESDNSADADKGASDSPDVIKTLVIYHGSNEKECAKGPLSENTEILEANGRMVGNVLSSSEDPKGNAVSESERVSTSESSSLVDPRKTFSSTSGQYSSVAPAACKTSSVVEGSRSSSGLFKMDVKSGQDVSHGSPQVSEVNVLHARSKSTPERKTRRSSAKGSGKESSTKGTHMKKLEKVEKFNNVPTSNPAIFHLVQSNEMQHHGHVESSGAKPFVFIGNSTSIPDLNNSTSPSPMFQQPFTDLQQVQLRAQIFVYGALIQGTAPDEAYMLSAFGGPDGGTNLWENAWRMCVDRLHGKKSHPSNLETPLQSQSGCKSTEQANKQSTQQSKVISPPVSRISSKSTPTALNPVIPLSSPLWSISTPSNALQSNIVPRSAVMEYQQALTPLHPYQTPPVRNFIGHNLSWFSQAPFHSTWVAPQTTAADSSARFSGLPMTEPVHLTPLKDSSSPQSSVIKPSGSMAHGGAPANVFNGASPLLDLKKISVTTGPNSTDSKSRRRKKNIVSDDPGQMTMQAQPQLKPVSAVLTTTISTLATSPSVHPKAASENLILSSSPLFSSAHLRNAGQDVRSKAILSDETLVKVREARQRAEDAALFASEAVKHSGEVWSQLDRQKNSALVSDVEAKLAAAAAAIAAAAAVAKAAAAAANVASNAALQAKLMADEALTSSGNEFSFQNSESFHGSAVGMGKATPASILRGEDGGNGSSSIIVVAREAARKRVEAASAASKHAENMDAIVKAAELAAAAVSHAGKIVAMGDPHPLRKLVEAGPEGYWKVPQVSSELVLRSEDVNGECADSSIKHLREGPPGKNKTQVSFNVKSAVSGEISMRSVESHPRLVDGFTNSVISREMDLRGQKDQNVSDLSKTIGVVPESELGARSSHNEHDKAKDINQDGIKEGSYVEVFKDGNGLKAAWFTANVLSLKEGRAYVCYSELQSEEGSGQLKEWVALDCQGAMPPRIRIARPITTFRNEGTRKRRRAAAGDHIWSVGDKVDAWLQNSWHEGVVVEKDAKDEATYTVRFSGRDETSGVKTWNLRPSLIWKDGEWFESSSSNRNDYSHEIVVPQEKRMKLGNLTAEVKRKDKISMSLEDRESLQPADSSLLVLSANEKVFNVGRNTQTDSKSNSLKTSRTGLQKGTSRVVIGVPKPGKKRKFMEVSKHYVADSMQTTEANDSVKLVKYVMPQGTTSKGLKRTSKSELKEKRANDFKPMGIKPGKQIGLSSKSISQKESINVVSADDPSTIDHAVMTKDTESQVEDASGKHNSMEGDSFCSIGEAVESSILFSSAHAPKKVSSFNNKPERANKGKLAPASGKLARIEEDKVLNGNAIKSNSKMVEPRRSNRRIQPTSRLLEGLQSSLTISKIPSVSHDKGPRNQNRNVSRGKS